MNVIPKGAPAPATSPQESHQKQQDARARAIRALSSQRPSDVPQGNEVVQNQTQVSPEELSAIQPREVNLSPEVEPSEPKLNEPAKAPEDPLSSQYAKLAKREQALRQQTIKQQNDFKAREEALKAREAQLAAKDQEYQQGYISKDKLKSDTLRILNEAGVPYDQLVQQYINETTNPVDPRVNATIAALEAKLAKLEAATEETKSSYSKQQSDAYDSAVKQIKSDVVNLVKSEPDQYEAIKFTGSEDDVVDLIKKTYEEEGRLMSVEEASEEVENYLIEESLRLSNLKKIKAKQAQASTPKPAQAQSPAPNQKQSQPMKTLTNAAGSTRQLSAKERAILAFKGELSKS